jgi:protein ImuB
MAMFASLLAARGSAPDMLLAVARDFSPRIAVCDADGREVTLDLGGLTRLFGDAKTIGEELRRTAADRGLRVRVAIAATRTAARLLAHHRAGVTVVDAGAEAAALDELPLELLEIFFSTPLGAGPSTPLGAGRIPAPESRIPNPESRPAAPVTTTLRRWGLRTLGDVAALPPADVAARLGQDGVAWQRLARGEDPQPLVPAVPEERFEQSLELEWPIEGLEPLSFVLARLFEPLCAHLERRDRGVAVLHVRLHLVTREIHERSLQLPAPLRDARTLRTLALLDLESHPPSAAIDRVVVAVDPTPGRVVQFSLLTRPLPSPEQLSTLMARLTALMGEDRCGSAVTVDSWQPGAFEMTAFDPGFGSRESGVGSRLVPSAVEGDSARGRPTPDSRIPVIALRRFRFPVPARVRVDGGVPVRISIDRRGLTGGAVTAFAGPWRTSGGWWTSNDDPHAPDANQDAPSLKANRNSNSDHRQWERDGWDVTLSDGATYRVFRERHSDAWFVEAIVD